jgi:hypothetical protein
MKRFPVFIQRGNKVVKRSMTISQIEVLYILSDTSVIEKHRKYFNATFVYLKPEMNSQVKVKRLPPSYEIKFT